MRRIASSLVIAALTCLPAAPARSVQTVNLEHTSEQDFNAAPARFENVVSNSRGRLRLARKLDVLLKDDKDVVFVNALAADAKGVVYAATAPNGKLFRIDGDKVELYYQDPDKAKGRSATLQSLAIGPNGEVYVGTGGGTGRIIQVTGKNEAKVVLEKTGLAYVWAIHALPDGTLLAGTGPAAELISVKPADKPAEGTVLFKPEKLKIKNIMAVACDGKQAYFGTDVDGLIFRYDLAAKRAFILYDAAETEISSLLLAGDGTLYAATSDTRGGGESQSQPAPGGRPDQPATAPQAVQTEDEGDESPDGEGDESEDESAVPKIEAIIQQPGVHSVPTLLPADGLLKPAPGFERAARLLADSPATQKSDNGPAASAAMTSATARPARPADAGKSATQPEGSRQDHGSVADLAARVRAAMAAARGGSAGSGAQAGGNAVYRISTDGFVSEVLRRPAMLMAMVLQADRLIVATADDGRVLAVFPGQEEVSTIAKPENVKQVLALAAGPNGTIYIGSANEALIARVGAGHSLSGVYTSGPIDAKAISRWGVIGERSATPAGTAVKVQTRSGNLAEPNDALWSPWSDPVAAADPAKIASPSARFIQYRLLLSSTDDSASPAVDAVSLSYANENQPPKVSAVVAAVPGGSGGKGDGEDGSPAPRNQRSLPAGLAGSGAPGGAEADGAAFITWQAADPNGDQLEAAIAFRREGGKSWIPLTDKPVRGEPKFRWPTQGVPDGRYEVRVTVSDAPGNPSGSALSDSRISDSFIVDNTPPAIVDLRIVSQDNGKIVVAAAAEDALSRLASAELKLDSATDGQPIQPLDGVWDQKRESLKATADLSGKSPGAHLLILTVTDAAGNTTSESIEVVKK